MMEERCETCRFGRPRLTPPVWIACHRRAPEQGMSGANWVVLDPHDWCGEWEAKPKVKTKAPVKIVMEAEDHA